MREHIKLFPNKYSFLLLVKSDIEWIDYTKALYFFDIGLITLYFDNIEKIKMFLIEIADKYTSITLD